MYFKTGWIHFEATLSLTRIDTSQVTFTCTFTFTFTFISHSSSQVKHYIFKQQTTYYGKPDLMT